MFAIYHITKHGQQEPSTPLSFVSRNVHELPQRPKMRMSSTFVFVASTKWCHGFLRVRESLSLCFARSWKMHRVESSRLCIVMAFPLLAKALPLVGFPCPSLCCDLSLYSRSRPTRKRVIVKRRRRSQTPTSRGKHRPSSKKLCSQMNGV